ncbi:hypothetical protein F4604DRAFT_1950281 [Suillus subluteus]|nr:hypothetical protein F4604DRAFT_1950281 [Suillus subluteus]
MNPLRDMSHPPSPAPNQSNFTPGSDQPNAHSVPVDNSVSISRRQETQNSLRQASVALDAAYDRVTQLRQNINNLLNRMPPEFAEGPSPARDRTTESSIAPQHAALVLTGSDTPESDVDFNTRVQRLRTIINPSARQRLEDFESMSRRRRGSTSERPLEVSGHRSQWWDTPADIPSRILPPHPRSPPLPDLILPSNNRTHISSNLEERSVFRSELGIINPDDPNTMIGRQVAARTALDRQSTTAPPLEQRLQNQSSVIARDLASLTSRLIRRGARRLEAARQAESERPSDRSSLQGQEVVPVPSETEMDWEPTIPQSNNDPLLTLVLDVAAVPDSSMRPSQPSSGASRRWTNNNADRTLLIDERGQGPPSVSERPLPHFINARSWPSEVTANGAGEASTSSSSVRRRRRWARLLNADGDEVISDDEDGVERNRRSQLHPEDDSFLPYTSASIMHPLDDDPAEAIRVRLNSHQQSKEDLFSHSISSHTYSQHVDPLPTPLSEMLRHPTVPAQVPRFIPVSKHASLAGR